LQHKSRKKHRKSDREETQRSVISGKRIKRAIEETEADLAARHEREERLRLLNDEEDQVQLGSKGADKPPRTVQEFAMARMKAARSDPKLMAQIMEEAKTNRKAKRQKWTSRFGGGADDGGDDGPPGARDTPSKGFPGHMQ